jgi:dTDP-4-amino-4,6-dideoxygalactose transaminase
MPPPVKMEKLNPAYIMRCPLAPQYKKYEDEIKRVIETVLSSGHYINGPNVSAFEEEFSRYIGCKYGVGVNSGTDALIMALWSLNLNKGDEVITTPFTFFATYAAIRQLELTPVFVDINPDTFLMDIEKVGALITRKTRVVLPVHLFGNVVDIPRLRKIVGKEIYIIEDCAQSHGASIAGRRAGALGDISAFSFFPSKNLGGYGDGGMVLTDNEAVANTIRSRRTFGMVNKDVFVEHGVNTRLDELQAGILRVKLRHLNAMNCRRKALAARYRGLLNPDYIKPQKIEQGVDAVYHVYSCKCSNRRDELAGYLERIGIQTNVYYARAINDQEAYKKYYSRKFNLPITNQLTKSIISIPFYAEMKLSTLEHVARSINRYFSNTR